MENEQELEIEEPATIFVNGKRFKVQQPKQITSLVSSSGFKVASAQSLALPKPSNDIYRKVVVKRVGNTVVSSKAPSKISDALNARLSMLRNSFPKLTDPRNLEIAMLKDETVSLKKVISECRSKMRQIQRTINGLNDQVQDVVQKLDLITKPIRIPKPSKYYIPPENLPVVKPPTTLNSGKETSEICFPLKTWVDLKQFELSLSNSLTFNRAMGLIRKVTNCVTFKRVSGAMTALLTATMSPQLQNHLRIREAPFGNVHLFKNYVSLFHLTVVRMCPSQPVFEKDIRNFLSDLFTRTKPSKLSVSSQDDEVVKWLQGEPLDNDDDREMEFEENTSEEECEPTVISLEPEADYDVLALDAIKTESE